MLHTDFFFIIIFRILPWQLQKVIGCRLWVLPDICSFLKISLGEYPFWETHLKDMQQETEGSHIVSYLRMCEFGFCKLFSWGEVCINQSSVHFQTKFVVAHLQVLHVQSEWFEETNWNQEETSQRTVINASSLCWIENNSSVSFVMTHGIKGQNAVTTEVSSCFRFRPRLSHK